MRRHLLTLVVSAALAVGIAGQASARDYHGDNRGHHGKRYHSTQHYDNRPHQNYRPYYSGDYDGRHAQPYYGRNYYEPPPPPVYHGGYGYGSAYGAGYSQPGFGLYIGR